MQRQETKAIVLARIPNLAGPWESSDRVSLSGGRRLLNQSISFKLLAGGALLLILLAIAPWTIGRQGSTTDPQATADAGRPATSVKEAAACDSLAAEAPALAPIGASRPAMSLTGNQQPTVAASEERMTPWSPPSSQSERRVEELPAGANRAMAIRLPEYTETNHDRVGPGVH